MPRRGRETPPRRERVPAAWWPVVIFGSQGLGAVLAYILNWINHDVAVVVETIVLVCVLGYTGFLGTKLVERFMSQRRQGHSFKMTRDGWILLVVAVLLVAAMVFAPP